MVDTTRMTEIFPLLLDTGLRGLVLLGLAGVFTLALRRASASARHLVWTLALVAMLALPAVRAVVPPVRVPLPALFSRSGAVDEAPASPVLEADAGAVTVRGSAPAPGSSAPGTAWVDESRGSEVERVAGTGESAGREAALGSEAGGASSSRAPAASWLAAAPVRAVLVAIWLIGALVLLLPLVVGWIGVRRLGRRAGPVDDPKVRHLATRLALRIGLRREFRLRLGPSRAMPMTWGVFRPTVMLPRESAGWPRARLEAVLLHELAHVARRDCLTQLVAEVARALHWFNPLAWVAARRLRVERELACDDVALAGGARASDYADELLGLARTYHASRATTFAAVAMARPSQLSGRLLAVLDERRSRRRMDRGLLLRTASAALALVIGLSAVAPNAPAQEPPPLPDMPATPPPESGIHVPAARAPVPAAALEPLELRPALPALPAFPALPALGSLSEAAALPAWGGAREPSCAAVASDFKSISHSSRNGRHTIKLEGEDCDLEVRLEGDVEFDAAGLTLAGMGPGARLHIEEDGAGVERTLDARPDSDGRPVYAYRRDGRDAPFDTEARDWYASVLVQLFRRTGFAADQRVDSILEREGVEGVLAELGRIESAHVFAQYTQLLLERAELDEAQVRALVRGSARRVDSDHYLAGILEAVASHQALRGGVLDDVIAATAALDSDHYRAGVLTDILSSEQLSPDQVAAVLASVEDIDSDHYRSEILHGIADRYALEPGIRQAYLDAAGSMDSDHYRAGVLADLLERDDLSARELAAVLAASRRIDSDHYRGEVLSRVAERGLGDPVLQQAYFESLDGFESDHYRAEALSALSERSDLTEPLLVGVLRSASALESDHYLAQILVDIARTRPLEGAAREAFLAAMDGIESDHYRGQVADALIRAERR